MRQVRESQRFWTHSIHQSYHISSYHTCVVMLTGGVRSRALVGLNGLAEVVPFEIEVILSDFVQFGLGNVFHSNY